MNREDGGCLYNLPGGFESRCPFRFTLLLCPRMIL
jgi:hypothetical protein